MSYIWYIQKGFYNKTHKNYQVSGFRSAKVTINVKVCYNHSNCILLKVGQDQGHLFQ